MYLFFLNDSATTEIYTLSLHDALPICQVRDDERDHLMSLASTDREGNRWAILALLSVAQLMVVLDATIVTIDRKSTRLNSSHLVISYAVFCLKKTNYSLS